MHFQKIIQFVLPILYILATIQPKKKQNHVKILSKAKEQKQKQI